jgi:hypothetical protein
MAIPDDPRRLILLARIACPKAEDETVEVLCLFALAPRAALLDVVTFDADGMTRFRDGAPQSPAPGTPLIVIATGQSVPDREFRVSETVARMIFIRGDRFSLHRRDGYVQLSQPQPEQRRNSVHLDPAG